MSNVKDQSTAGLRPEMDELMNLVWKYIPDLKPKTVDELKRRMPGFFQSIPLFEMLINQERERISATRLLLGDTMATRQFRGKFMFALISYADSVGAEEFRVTFPELYEILARK